jgi:nitrite reductase (NADH) large subunit
MSKLREDKRMKKERAGMAATRLVEELVARAPGGYALRLTGEEPRPPYNRLLSSVPADEIAGSEIGLRSREWRRAVGVEMLPRASIAATRRSLMFDAPLVLEAA